MEHEPLVIILLYFILPLWLAVGFADWLCHRATQIERTTGAKESVLHLLMFAEVGVPLLAAIFLEINAGVILLMIAGFIAHEATALWDVSYAVTARKVSPFEQHVHSFLELIPLMAIICVVGLHWDQFLALFGLGDEAARFAPVWKLDPLPVTYVLVLMGFILVLEVVPFVEELVRGLRANRGALVPPVVRHDDTRGRPGK